MGGKDLYLSMTLNDKITIPYIGDNNVNVSYIIFRIIKMLTFREKHNLKLFVHR